MDEKNKIKNIIFDLGEVLLTGIRDTGLGLREKHNLSNNIYHNADGFATRPPFRIPPAEEFFHGKISEDEFIAEVLKTCPQIGTKEYLKEHIRANFREIEGTREIIIELKKLGYKMAILSIHGREWVDYLEKKFNFHKLFDVHSFSYNEGVSKPHPTAFQRVLQKLNAKPEECLFIDDNKENIAAAEALGIKSILFTNAADLQDNLRHIISNF
jgi:putative hydrolase of the HAD superfamily